MRSSLRRARRHENRDRYESDESADPESSSLHLLTVLTTQIACLSSVCRKSAGVYG